MITSHSVLGFNQILLHPLFYPKAIVVASGCLIFTFSVYAGGKVGRGSVGFKDLHGIYHVDVIIDHRQEITKYNSPNQNLFITQMRVIYSPVDM